MAASCNLMEYHQQCINNLCRICGGRAQRACDIIKKIAPKKCVQYKEKIHIFYDLDLSNDSPGTHPPNICKSCFMKMKNSERSKNGLNNSKYLELKEMASETSKKWVPHKRQNCEVCQLYSDQKKGGGQKKVKLGNPNLVCKKVSLDATAEDIQSSMPIPSSLVTSTPITNITQKNFKVAEVQTSPQEFRTPKPKNTSTTFEESLGRSITSPLSKEEENLHTKLTKRKLTYSADNTITCKTGGQPIVFMKLRKARKPSSEAKSPLKRKRAKQLERCRRLVSGRGRLSTQQQQSSELKILKGKSKFSVCRNAGVVHKTSLSKKVSLAMKTSMGISWRQHRAQKRFLKRIGVQFESEKKEREVRDNITDKFTAKYISCTEKDDKNPGSIGGFCEVEAPYVYVTSLVLFVETLLNGYHQFGKLNWDRGMPNEEIWIKIGGDHGGSSFKLTLQVLNLDAPNSKENTIVVGCCIAKDYYSNLKEITSVFKPEIERLNQSSWRNHRYRIFMFGDYAFLCSMYGLSGARGTHFCLWCHITTTDMQMPIHIRGFSDIRKLRTLRSDHKKFQVEGKGKKIHASLYNNSINEPLWDIKINHVCPPYLHILLGIVKKHHDLLEQECNQLDIKVAKELARSNYKTEDELFDKYIKSVRDWLKKLDKLKYNKQQLIVKMEKERKSPEMKKMKADLVNIENEITVVREKQPKLNVNSGPISSHLEVILKKNKIEQQAYHSRSFIGNHCVKYIKPDVTKQLCMGVVEKTVSISGKQEIITESKQICEKFKKLNNLYYAIHDRIGHGNAILESDHQEIEDAIHGYMEFYRECFPNKILPKHHILEDHILQWIHRWHFGLALHGEQGGESVHKEFNRLQRAMYGIQNPLHRLLSVMKEHHTIVSPAIQSHVAVPSKRKKCDKTKL